MYLPGNLNWKALLEKDPLLKHGLITASYFCVAMTALFAPEDVLSRWGVLERFGHAVSGVVPSVSDWVAVSDFPQVTELVFTLGWVLAPIQAFAAYRLEGIHAQLVAHWRRRRSIRLTVPLAIFVILPALVWGGLSVGWESRNCVGVCLGKSRISLALIGPFIPMACAFSVVVIIVWLRRFKQIYGAET